MIFSVPSNVFSLTPYTTVFKSPLAGADIITFFAPAVICAMAFSLLVNLPVHSNTISISKSFHGKLFGSNSLYTFIFLFFTIIPSSSCVISFGRYLLCEVSYFNKYDKSSGFVKSLMATTSISLSSSIILNTKRPIRPNPLIATFIIISNPF